MNSNKSILALTMLLTITLFSSCKKEDGILKGKITYQGSLSGIVYVAAGAKVTLHLGFANGDPVETVNTDSEGNYLFNNLSDATWHINSSITVNGIQYSGTAETNAIVGDNVVTLNLLLKN